MENQFQTEGLSFENAIVITHTNTIDGVKAEYDYIRSKYPEYIRVSQKLIKNSGKTYDILTLRKDKDEVKLYFNIDAFFGMERKAKQKNKRK